MIINRRQFLLLTAGLAAGCQAVNDGGGTAAKTDRVIEAGPAGNYVADGVYDYFRDQGFFLIRRDGNLIALSAICHPPELQADRRGGSFLLLQMSRLDLRPGRPRHQGSGAARFARIAGPDQRTGTRCLYMFQHCEQSFSNRYSLHSENAGRRPMNLLQNHSKICRAIQVRRF